MALSDNLKNSANEIQRLNDLGTEFSAIYSSIGESLKGLARDSREFGSGINDAERLSKDLAKSAQELAGFTKEDLKDRKKAADFAKKSQSLASKRAKLQSQIRVFQAQSVNATKAEQAILEKVNRNLSASSDYTKEITEGFDEILDTSKKLEKTNPFKGVGDLVSQIPVLNKFFPEFEKASQTFRDNMADGQGFLKSSAKSGGQLAGFFNKLTVGLAVKGLQDFDERSTSLARNLNVSRQQADQLVKSANAAAGPLGTTGKKLTQAQQDFSEALGTTAVLSNETAANFSTLTSKLGLSVDQASSLTQLSEALGKNSKTQTEELIAQVQLGNAQTDSSIKYQDVLKDVAGANKAILLSSRGNSKELAKAAFEAKRFGLTLNQTDNIAGSLLDFESSISAELEAELLTGKSLNLERARQAALDGDLATLTSEIAKNVGSAEEFSNMNRLQQEAIAKSVGMTRESLAESLVEQQALTKLGAKDENSLRSRVKEELKKVDAIKDAEEREKARGELIKKLGSDELVRQQETKNLQELQAQAAQRIIEAFDKLSPILGSVRDLMKGIANNAGSIASALGVIAGISLIGKFRKLLKLFKGLKNAASGLKSFFGGGSKTVTSAVMKESGKKVYGAAAQSAVKAGSATAVKAGTKTAAKSGTKVAAKAGAKLGGKTLLKRIPILGSVVGLGFAIDRAIKGDFAGAALEAGSAGLGLLDLAVPGLGTGSSLAMDAGIAARDFKRAGTITPTATPMATGGIVTQPTNALVGEAGAEAVIPLNEFYKKFDELIAAVKQGGDVYMDSTKVGTAMAVGSFRVQ